MILDSDIAKIYGVETKRVNESVQRNLDKFPQGYIFEISKKELENLLLLFGFYLALKQLCFKATVGKSY